MFKSTGHEEKSNIQTGGHFCKGRGRGKPSLGPFSYRRHGGVESTGKVLGKRPSPEATQSSEQAREQPAAAALVLLQDLLRGGNRRAAQSCAKYCC